MIQIPQALLILGKQDDMPGVAVINATLGAQLGHHWIDFLKIVDIMLLFQLLQQPGHNGTANNGIIPLTITQEMLDAAYTPGGWGGVFVLNGDNFKCTKISIVQ